MNATNAMPMTEMFLARGRFDVELTPQPNDGANAEPGVGRMTLSKTFHGDLEGTSRGQMLSAMTEVEGSAAYVAIEQFVGTLHGRRGGFALQHRGVMTRGTPELSVTVVPDSGRGEMIGLAGSMDIILHDGSHKYEFRYSLPPSAGKT